MRQTERLRWRCRRRHATGRSAAACGGRRGRILAVRILHAIHDFLPRHQAGSEIYAFELCRALSARHHVTIVCAEYDLSRDHGSLRWRACGGLPVVEIANHWACESFEASYRPDLVTRRLGQVLRTVQPDVLHVHSLLNLSFDLPLLAHARGIPVVATLHDYTLVCPSGGQRIHRAESHVYRDIEIKRCARCFVQSPVYDQLSFASLTGKSGRLRRLAAAAARRLPLVAEGVRRAVRRAGFTVTPAQIAARLDAARGVFEAIDLFVAPSASLAAEF